MAKHKRIVFLGPTGVDKTVAAKRIEEYMTSEHGQDMRYVDFENEYLKK